MYTVETLKAWAGNDYNRWLMLSVARDSWGVYQMLRKNYKFPFQWARGVERSDYNTKAMLDALKKEAAESKNPLAFAAMVDRSLPVGKAFTDPTIMKRIQRVMRENP